MKSCFTKILVAKDIRKVPVNESTRSNIINDRHISLTYLTSLVSFCTPLKTSENLWFSDAFRGYKKRPMA